MHPLDGLAQQTTFFSRNIAHNLDFIPDDKLDWKPAPSANSAMEVVRHLLGAQAMVGAMLTGANPQEAAVAQPQTRDEAKAALAASADDHAAILLAIDPSTLGEIVQLPWGAMPKAFVAGIAAADTIHHHGQISYIQTLLGDIESHFDMSLVGG
jgi:uncharacterized damage-inducible protein DinB